MTSRRKAQIRRAKLATVAQFVWISFAGAGVLALLFWGAVAPYL